MDGLEREFTINADSVVMTRMAYDLWTGKVKRICIDGVAVSNDLVHLLLDQGSVHFPLLDCDTVCIRHLRTAAGVLRTPVIPDDEDI